MRNVLLVAVAAALLSQEAAVKKPEHYAGILTAGLLTARPQPIELDIERWATDETRGRFAALFREGAQAALLDALKKEKTAGYVRLPSMGRLTVAYAEDEPRPDGGRRILLLCARLSDEWERTSGQGWTDYPFRIVALSLDAAGHGTGMVFHAAKVSFAANGVELLGELSGQPTRILSIQPR